MNPNDPTLLKLGEYNKKMVERFEMVRVPEEQHADQYFLMFGMDEGEAFNPENIRGVWGAEPMAKVIAGYRQDGILRIPHPAYMMHRAHGEMRYEYVQPSWCYFLNVDSIIHKVPKGTWCEDEIKENTSEV